MKGRPLIIQRQGMTSPFNILVKRMARDFEGPEPLADALRHFVDRQAIRGDGIPESEKPYDRNPASFGAIRRQHRALLTQPLTNLLVDQPPIGVKVTFVVGAVSLTRLLVELRFCLTFRRNEALA